MTVFRSKVDHAGGEAVPHAARVAGQDRLASFLGVPLHVVPNFVELGDRGEDGYALGWWWAAVGFMAAHGLGPVDLDDVDGAAAGELVFVAGPSARGVTHQVLYLDGELWHDPHPSRAGVVEITEVLAWRPQTHDHKPTPMCPVIGPTGRCLQPHGHLAEQVDHTYPPAPTAETVP